MLILSSNCCVSWYPILPLGVAAVNSPYPGRDPTASLLFGDDPSFGLSVEFGAQLLQILLELEGGACVAHGTQGFV